MLANNNNEYGMYLTPEELKNSQLMAQLKLQQAAMLAQQQAYTYGWHDPQATQQKYSLDKFEPTIYADLFKKEPIPMYKWCILAATLTLVVGITLKVIL